MVNPLCARIVRLLPLLFLAGCAAGPSQPARPAADLPPAEEPVYVVPFLAVMTPPEVAQEVFDRLVDTLNEGGGREFVIVKRGRDADGRAWLADKPYLEGEIFGYYQQSGCCSTELRLRTRLFYHPPGAPAPLLLATLPRQVFFDHDRSTLEVERERLIAETAQNLAAAVASFLAAPAPHP